MKNTIKNHPSFKQSPCFQKIWHIVASGLEIDTDLEILRKIVLVNLLIIFSCTFLVILGVLAFAQNNLILGILDFSFVLILCILFIIQRWKKNSKITTFLGTGIGGIFLTFILAQGGVSHSAFVWAFTYPLISIFLLGIRKGSFSTLLLLFIAILIFIIGPHTQHITTYELNLALRFVPAYLSIYLFAMVMETLRHIVQRRLGEMNKALVQSNQELEKTNKEKEKLIAELKSSFLEIKTLQGILPICANCKKVRNDSGYWEQVEEYIHKRSDAQFSHSICPECVKKLYPEYTSPDENE